MVIVVLGGRQAQGKARTTPCLLGLDSFVSLLAARLLKAQSLPARREAWYAKQRATFSDTLAFVRRWLWRQQHFQSRTRRAT